jgi:hypothetical protein
MDNEYLSDDDKKEGEEEKELTLDEMYPDEEMDEETLNLIYNNSEITEINFEAFDISKSKKKDKKKDKQKENNIISLKSLSEQFTEKKVEKWVSKRNEGKRIDSKIQDTKKQEPRYKFNPRLPPFNTIFKEYNNEKQSSIINDETNFPSLKN